MEKRGRLQESSGVLEQQIFDLGADLGVESRQEGLPVRGLHLKDFFEG
ncbi:MAG TPA: hypothetical protein VM120_02520 [Bryobacteraceae bacterium]|nr:hypothetical protein [Bryobacteraceae bacterium]